jgi:thiol:disulfide interchange protein
MRCVRATAPGRVVAMTVMSMRSRGGNWWPVVPWGAFVLAHLLVDACDPAPFAEGLLFAALAGMVLTTVALLIQGRGRWFVLSLLLLAAAWLWLVEFSGCGGS